MTVRVRGRVVGFLASPLALPFAAAGADPVTGEEVTGNVERRGFGVDIGRPLSWLLLCMCSEGCGARGPAGDAGLCLEL